MTRKSKKADIQANEDNPIAEEIESIKNKNINLAKQLEQYKIALTEAVEERDQAKRELLGERAFSGKILRYVGDIQKAAKSNLNAIVSSSNYVSEILKVTNSIHHLTNKEKTIHSETVSLANSPNKTQVVNPMIAGHVILRPIINLQRVNEISSEEIRRLSNPHLQLNNSNLVDNYNNTSEEPSPSSSNPSSQSGIIRHGEDNQILEFKFEEESRRGLDGEFEQNTGLGTIMEEAEVANELPNNILELSRPGCSNQPLLSGVFHDVRMYVSSVPDMLENINTQRGSSTKSLKLTKSPNMASSKSSKKLSNRNKSCVQTNNLEENFDLSSDNFNLLGTPVLSSTRLNVSNLMLTEPRPSTSFRPDDDSSNSLSDTDQPEQQATVKRVTFRNVNVFSRRGKRENESNNAVKNIETVLQSPDSCSKTPEKSSKLNTTTQLNDLPTSEQTLKSLQETPTSSKIDTPLLSETSHLRVSRRKKVVATTSDDKVEPVPKSRGRPKAKKNINNITSVPIKRITRSKYRKPKKYADSVYTGRKSDETRKSDSKKRESLELIKENSETSDSKSSVNASKSQIMVSKSRSTVSKNKSVTSSNQSSIVSNNLTNESKSTVSINASDTNISTNNKSGKRKMQKSQSDTNAFSINKSEKRKIQESHSETLLSSPKKRRAARVQGSLKEPSLMRKMRR